MLRLLTCVRAALIVGLLAVSCGPATPPATTGPLQPVRLNWSAASGAHAALWYAYENGLFQKYGLAPDLTHISSSRDILAAMLRGEVDFSTATGTSVVSSVAAGEERVLIAAFYNQPLFHLVVGPDIQTPDDLIGTSIATGSVGGIRHDLSLIALTHLGLDPATQVNFVSIRENDEALVIAAIEGGSASGGVLAPPLLARQREAGLHVLLDLSDLEIAYLRLGLSAMRSYLAEHREVAVGVLKALLEAVPLMRQDREGTQAVLAKYIGLDPVADAEDLAALYDVFVAQHLEASFYPAEAALQYALDSEVSNNPAVANLTTQHLVDLSLLDDIHASGFMESLP